MQRLKQWFNLNRILGLVISLIALFSSILGIYTFFFQANHLSFEILTNTNVLDLHEDVGELDILFKGDSLKKSKERLRIINIKVINDGSGSIIKNFYDDNDQLGINVNKGIIVDKPEIIDASNDYIKKNLRLQLTPNNIRFSSIILDPGDYYLLKVLILEKNNTQPTISPLGKIATIKTLKVIKSYDQQESSAFIVLINSLYKGDFIIQLMRIISYGILFILFIVGTVVFTDWITGKWRYYKRSKALAIFNKTFPKFALDKKDDVVDIVLKQEDFTIYKLQNLLNDQKSLYALSKDYEKGAKTFGVEDSYLVSRDIYIYSKLVKEKYVDNHGNINDQNKNRLFKFIEIMFNKGIIKKIDMRINIK